MNWNRHSTLASSLLLNCILACNPSGEPPVEPAKETPAEQTQEEASKGESSQASPDGVETREPLEVERSRAVAASGKPSSGASTSREATPKTTPTTIPGKSGKVSAPATVNLSISGTSGTIEATFEVQVSADVPQAVAKFVLPAGAELVSGNLETDFGVLEDGAERQVSIRLVVPDGVRGTLAAGVDLHLSSGVRLHAGDAVAVGGAP